MEEWYPLVDGGGCGVCGGGGKGEGGVQGSGGGVSK